MASSSRRRRPAWKSRTGRDVRDGRGKAGQLAAGTRLYRSGATSRRPAELTKTRYPVESGRTNVHAGKPGAGKRARTACERLVVARRVEATLGSRSATSAISTIFPLSKVPNIWDDTVSSFMADKIYVVQTNAKIIERCLLMTTDPGDLVLDPTCGSGTTAYVAEQWGRRWITIDTSRVALALARQRLMGAKFPYYLLADSPEGREKEGELSGSHCRRPRPKMTSGTVSSMSASSTSPSSRSPTTRTSRRA